MTRALGQLISCWITVLAILLFVPLEGWPENREALLERAERLSQQVIQLYQQGQYAQAIQLAHEALRIREQALGPAHPHVATSLNILAELYRATGQYAKAEPLYQRSLAIREQALGPAHPDVATSLNNLALLYDDTGQYAKAEPLYQRSLAILEKALGPAHPHVAASLNNLAVLYKTTGQYAKAEPLYQRSLAILEQARGPAHPDVAGSLNNLAALYRNTGQYAKAEPLLQRSLAIWEKALGPAHPHVATSLNNLALLYRNTGQYAKAEPLSQRSLAIVEQALGPAHPDVATSLNNLALLYDDTGQYAKAEPLYQRSLAIREQALGPAHPHVAQSLTSLALLAAAQHDYARANRLFTQGLRVEDRQIQDVFAFTTEEQKLQFMETIQGSYHGYLSLLHQHLSRDPDALRDGVELVLRRKGVIFDAEARTHEAVQGRLSEAARQDWTRLSALRSELARLLLQKPDAMSAEAYRERLAALNREIEEVEQRLAKESGLVAKERQQRTITRDKVAKQLPKHAALVEFAKIRDLDFAEGTWRPTWRYLAFVLTAAEEVVLADLGEADAVEGRIRRALEDIQVSMKRQDRLSNSKSLQSLKALYATIWIPLEAPLKGVTTVVLSPDGQLALVPFAALMDAQDRPLVDQVLLAYVNTGRDLVGAEGPAPHPTADLILVANPAYDTRGRDSAGQGAAVRSREFRAAFTLLPGTEREAQEIPALVAGKTGVKRILTGEQATEGAVKAARSPRILHLATHGFFLADEELDLEQGTRRGLLEGALAVRPRAPTKRYENPLVRAGLAFAGANQAARVTDGDDGILTALEVSSMDLAGTELVVLSACDTGVGEVKTGEGVFGLRRAFALAGAKNLLMSLWPVSDEITANQMKAFYQNLQKLPPSEALRQAQLETIQQLKAIAIYGGTAPPGLWAPFILQGAQALGQ